MWQHLVVFYIYTKCNFILRMIHSFTIHSTNTVLFIYFLSHIKIMKCTFIIIIVYNFFLPFMHWLQNKGRKNMNFLWKWKWSLSVFSNSLRPRGLVAYQASPSMGFSRQEYWSGLPFPSPGDLADPGIKPRSPTLQADALTSEPPGKPHRV